MKNFFNTSIIAYFRVYILNIEQNIITIRSKVISAELIIKSEKKVSKRFLLTFITIVNGY